VVLAISLPEGVFGTGYPEALFQGHLDCRAHDSFADLDGVEVSAHGLLDRAGALTQFVPFHGRAWHAGVSQWQGRERCNDFSIGIELEGEARTPFTWAQYLSLAALARQLRVVYGLAPEAFACHSEIAPGRKTDPGPYFSRAVLSEAEASL
jgi:AmpD protein